MQKEVRKSQLGLKGEVVAPADKSISHRAAIILSLVKGKSVVKNFSKGADCLSTLSVLKNLGIETKFGSDGELFINSENGFKAPEKELFCGNSGTTIRLMSGVLAGQNFDCVLTGDESLSKRPMKRIIEPLELMGAKIIASKSPQRHPELVSGSIQESNFTKVCFTAPLKILASKLNGIDYHSPISSAQVKSCVLLAGLFAQGKTTFTEPFISRNHTERMLEYLGAKISVQGNTVTIEKSQFEPKTITVPGDISSAAFFIVAALIVKNSDILIKNVGLNPTRTGILEVLQEMGADIEILDKKLISNEQVGDLRVRFSELKACEISGELIPKLIDELPIIALLATQAQGETVIKDAQDLRNKESDRISAVVSELKKLGSEIEETADGFRIKGKSKLKGGVEVESYHDHRLAMMLYVAGLICYEPILINDFEWVNISFPDFEKLLEDLI